MKALLERDDLGGAAVFCANDYMAAGAMAVLQEHGFQIPRDVSVMGFDDMDVAKCVFPGLTTMRVDTRRLGACAVDRLMQLIDGKEETEALPEVILPATLKERNTVLNDTTDHS